MPTYAIPEVWHHRVERRHDHWHYVPRYWYPRFVRAVVHHAFHPHYRPWYRDARRIYIHDDPFYFHVGLGLYIGGIAIQFELGNQPPYGYVYYDPYCDEVFWTLAEDRSWRFGRSFCLARAWVGSRRICTAEF